MQVGTNENWHKNCLIYFACIVYQENKIKMGRYRQIKIITSFIQINKLKEHIYQLNRIWKAYKFVVLVFKNHLGILK